MAEGEEQNPPFSEAQLAAMEAVFERVCDRRLREREDNTKAGPSDTAASGEPETRQVERLERWQEWQARPGGGRSTEATEREPAECN